jgi:hypothetical protein
VYDEGKGRRKREHTGIGMYDDTHTYANRNSPGKSKAV